MAERDAQSEARVIAAAALVDAGLEDPVVMSRLTALFDSPELLVLEMVDVLDPGVIAAVGRILARIDVEVECSPTWVRNPKNAVVTAALLGFILGHEYVRAFGPLPRAKE